MGVVKQCLENIPEERPTTEQLVRVLEGLKGDIEGPYGEMMIVDAVRQVKMSTALKKTKDNADKLSVKEEEIQQLQQQLEVCQCTWYMFPTTVNYDIMNLVRIYRQLMNDAKWSYIKRMKKYGKRMLR